MSLSSSPEIALSLAGNTAGYLLMEKVPNFMDSDVQKLTDPLMPLVERSKGLQVMIHDSVALRDHISLTSKSVFSCSNLASSVDMLSALRRTLLPQGAHCMRPLLPRQR